MTDITMLELQEFLFAKTTVENVQSRGPDEGRMHARESLRLHRFQVFTWLMHNGVAIPAELLDDRLHVEAGKQSVDKPMDLQPAPRDLQPAERRPDKPLMDRMQEPPWRRRGIED